MEKQDTLIFIEYCNMLNQFTYNDIEYTITGPIEVVSDTQIHVHTDKGILLIDNTMPIYDQLN